MGDVQKATAPTLRLETDKIGSLSYTEMYNKVFELFAIVRVHTNKEVPDSPKTTINKNRHAIKRIRDKDAGTPTVYAGLTEQQRTERYNKKDCQRKEDKLAVTNGTASGAQYNRVQVSKLCTKNYCDLMAMLRVMQQFEPSAFAEVPDFCKTGLGCSQHFTRVASDRTQEKIAARLEEITNEGLHCEVYSNQQFAELLTILLRRVETILRTCIAYIGFTWRSGRGFDIEVARWANQRDRRCKPAITRLDETPITDLQDLLDLDFQVETLHRSAFAFNCRVLETELHRSFKHSNNRLWTNVGSGSYFLKDEDIQHQRDNALISSVFIVYAPCNVVSHLSLHNRLPLFVQTHGAQRHDHTMEIEDEDILPC